MSFAVAQPAFPPTLTVLNSASFDAPVSPGAAITLLLSSPMGPGFPPSSQLSVALITTDRIVFRPEAITRVSDGELRTVVPGDLPPGNVTVQASTANGGSITAAIRVIAFAPAIFTVSETGDGPAAAQTADGSLNRLTNPSLPGEAVTLWATGLGTAIAAELSVEVGGRLVLVDYAGHHSTPGLDQINVRLPVDVPLGCYVPVTIHAGGVVSNVATLAINPTAGGCAHPLGLSYTDLQTLDAGGTIVAGSLQVSDSLLDNWSSAARMDLLNRDAAGIFRMSLPQRPYTLTPACQSSSGVPRFITSAGFFLGIDAGDAIELEGPANKRLPMSNTGFYTAILLAGKAAYFNAGPWSVTIPGGADVAAFRGDFMLPPAIRWLNKPSVITTSRDLRIEWDPSGYTGSEEMTVRLARVPGNVQCTTYAWRGSLTIPRELLPEIQGTPSQGYLTLELTPHPNARPVYRVPLTRGGTAQLVSTYLFNEVRQVSIQ